MGGETCRRMELDSPSVAGAEAAQPPQRGETKGQGSKFRRLKTAASGMLVLQTSVLEGPFLGKSDPANGHVEERSIAVEKTIRSGSSRRQTSSLSLGHLLEIIIAEATSAPVAIGGESPLAIKNGGGGRG